ncbi:hypothetical protein QQX98_013015 [Neonectria punicea]|uniref:Aminoglycoside phosphotransferase domain-containing protein n=1 Tax=Neonectria punicea TaxID=979145 RepID=A0ABR1GH58_9HYPO
MGCANYHARIRFGNGSPSWLMRVPRVSGFAVGFPVSLAEYLIRSEYATLKFLETTAVPAPRAFSFGIPSQGTDHGIGLSDSKDKFFLKHVDDKGDHLMVDEDLNITSIIDWQMARIVPRREVFALSLVSANIRALCGGDVSLSTKDLELSNALREKGAWLASYTGDEKVRRFFWGLGLEPNWAYALPLANAILRVFGFEQGWDEWKEVALKRYEGDERLKVLMEESSGSTH